MAIETYKRRNFISQILDIDNSHMFPLEVKIGVNNQLTLLLSVDGSSIVHGLISKYSHFLPLKDQLPEILGRLPKVQLQEMKGEAEELVVMNTTPVITEISENAINNQPRLKHIVFEEGLSKVNSHAFDTCDSLEKISFPKSLRELEDNIFHVCRNIKEIYLPGSCKVGRNVFPRRDSLIHFYQTHYDMSESRKRYFQYKIGAVIVSYYVAALLKNPDRRKGRCDVAMLRQELHQNSRDLMQQTEKKYWITKALHLVHMTPNVFGRIKRTRFYYILKKFM